MHKFLRWYKFINHLWLKPPNLKELRSLKFWMVLVLRWIKNSIFHFQETVIIRNPCYVLIETVVIEHSLLVIQRTICRHIVGYIVDARISVSDKYLPVSLSHSDSVCYPNFCSLERERQNSNFKTDCSYCSRVATRSQCEPVHCQLLNDSVWRACHVSIQLDGAFSIYVNATFNRLITKPLMLALTGALNQTLSFFEAITANDWLNSLHSVNNCVNKTHY